MRHCCQLRERVKLWVGCARSEAASEETHYLSEVAVRYPLDRRVVAMFESCSNYVACPDWAKFFSSECWSVKSFTFSWNDAEIVRWCHVCQELILESRTSSWEYRNVGVLRPGSLVFVLSEYFDSFLFVLLPGSIWTWHFRGSCESSAKSPSHLGKVLLENLEARRRTAAQDGGVWVSTLAAYVSVWKLI